MWRGILSLVVFVAVVLSVVAYTFGYVVQPGFVGVRQITFGPYQGFSREGLRPGYHWSIPFYSRIHFVPATIQFMDFDHIHQTDTQVRGSLWQQHPLEVQTTNGQSMFVDLSLLYRFYEAKGDSHGGPDDLVTRVGSEEREWRDRIITVVENELKKALGRLSTSEFYNPYLRQKEVEQAEKNMATRLAALGIKVEGVLLRRYTYAAADIDEAIYQKNLTVLAEQVNAAEGKLKEVRALVAQVASKGDAAVKTMLVEGENQARIIRSRADLYESLKQAEGNLAVAQSKAQADQLRADALLGGSGAQVYVAREMVPFIRALKGGVLSDLEPFNIEAWLKSFGVKKEAAE